MSFERMRRSFKSFLGINTSPQIDQSSQPSISIPQELHSSNSQYNIQNKFVHIEKKLEHLNPYKKSLIRLNEYQKTIIKGTDCSKCPTIQYQINKDEKPVIDHKISNPRWKRDDQSQNYSSHSQRWNSQNDVPNPTFYKLQSKPIKNQIYDPQTLSQSSINFQKKQFLQYLEDKPINIIKNENTLFEDQKKKSSQISIRRTENVIFDLQDENAFENGRQTIQKQGNPIKSNDEENENENASIIIRKQTITKFNKLKKQEFEYNPNIPLIETKPISPSYMEVQQKQQIQKQEIINKTQDEQQSVPIKQIQEPLLEIKQESNILQKIEPLTQPSVIEVNPFTSNIDNTLFSAPWLTNQQPQNQPTFNQFQSQPIQNEFQIPFISQQQQQSVFPFQNQSQIQQNEYSNQQFFSQQVQTSPNPFMTNQLSQNVFNQNTSQQVQLPHQTFQQNKSNTNDFFQFNQQKQQNNNNSFLFQTNSLGGGSFSADDQNKKSTIDLFSAQPIQNSQAQMITSQAPVNLFTLDQNILAQQQTNKESDRYKNKLKSNTFRYNGAAQRME